MGWRTTRGVSLAALVATGCLGADASASPSPEPVAWQAPIRSLQEGTKAVVTLVDSTGLVTGIGQGDRLLAGVSSNWVTVAVSPEDEAPGIAVVLIGSPCDEAFGLTLLPFGDSVLLARAPTPQVDCDTIAVGYELAIDLSEPVEASRLIAHDVDEDGRFSWGFLVPGSDGLSRPVTVIGGRMDLLRAAPLDPSSLPAVTGDVGLSRPLVPAELVLVAWASEACHDEMTLSAFPAQPLEIGLVDTRGVGCGGPKHLQGVALMFHPNTDTAGIEAVVVKNR